MHMSDSLISVAVGTSMAAVSTGLMGYSIRKVKNAELMDHKIPMMGVMGAFVFAAQMINFTIPVTGSSGHISGGVLLAAILGPYPAFLTMACVLLIQALLFADGGLLALGCNIFNLGFFACILVFHFLYQPILKKGLNSKRIMITSILSVLVSLQFGALSVVLETTLSGVAKLPFLGFLAPMQLIHLAIGLVEGIATGAILCFIYDTRKEILENTIKESKQVISTKQFTTIFIIVTIIVGGIISLFASSKPDGLEWSIQGITKVTEGNNLTSTHDKAEEIQEVTALLPDYKIKNEEGESKLGTSISGLVGSGVTLLGVLVIGTIAIKLNNKKKKSIITE